MDELFSDPPRSPDTGMVYEAIVHRSTGQFEADNRQRCEVCNQVLLDHSSNLARPDGAPLDARGEGILPFPAGPVTLLRQKHHEFETTRVGPIVAVAYPVDGAHECEPHTEHWS